MTFLPFYISSLSDLITAVQATIISCVIYVSYLPHSILNLKWSFRNKFKYDISLLKTFQKFLETFRVKTRTFKEDMGWSGRIDHCPGLAHTVSSVVFHTQDTLACHTPESLHMMLPLCAMLFTIFITSLPLYSPFPWSICLECLNYFKLPLTLLTMWFSTFFFIMLFKDCTNAFIWTIIFYIIRLH